MEQANLGLVGFWANTPYDGVFLSSDGIFSAILKLQRLLYLLGRVHGCREQH